MTPLADGLRSAETFPEWSVGHALAPGDVGVGVLFRDHPAGSGDREFAFKCFAACQHPSYKLAQSGSDLGDSDVPGAVALSGDDRFYRPRASVAGNQLHLSTPPGLTQCREDAKRRVDKENALLVDIRDVRELEREGQIPGAFHAPRGMLEFWVDPESPYFKEAFAEDRELIFF